MPEFQKILIANRGEIAIRVMRAANELGKRTVAVYAEEDKFSLHRFKADEAYKIGEGMGPVAAYLSIDEVIRVARMCEADAIHPGYGLLSENPDFVDACAAAGIAFIGPKADTMRAIGDKASARQVAIRAGVPVIPATGVLGDDMAAIAKEAEEIGYPLMLKASWGGGGRGMRPIMGPDELDTKVKEGRREAEAAFGNGEGYLEKMILKARHVEVQILGDNQGNIYHLWERDCSVQRRNQKVVERAPAPYLSPTQREELAGLGKKIAEAVDYECAGTIEFLMDMADGRFYFIEVNPRLQVEHTVTEADHRHRHRAARSCCIERGLRRSTVDEIGPRRARARCQTRRLRDPVPDHDRGSRRTTSSPTTGTHHRLSRRRPASASGSTAARPIRAR